MVNGNTFNALLTSNVLVCLFFCYCFDKFSYRGANRGEARVWSFFLMLKTVLNEGQIDQRKIRKFKSLLGAL